jgi:CelD/BcsL family acetyltransferase involved in cellulose biosynthesis
VASLIGGSWANYRLGLFRPDRVWTAADVAALLRAAGKQAGIDLFAFSSLPADWEGRGNPLALLPGSSSPSAAFATRLPATHGEWLDAHLSRATQKKLRKKARKLEAFGPLRHVRREGEAGARFLDAFLTHKAAQAAARGERDAFAPAQVRDFLRRLLASGAMEMHALVAGERIAATLGALPCARRLSGLVISYDGAHEVAAASPGEWLVSEVVRDAVARGFSVFDLGAGEARYKRELCEIEESLRDAAFGVTPLGRLSAAGFLVARSAKGAIKRRPALFRLARRLRRAVSR